MKKHFYNKKNELFSALGGEDFTNGEVIIAHAGIFLILLACSFAEWLIR